MIDLSRFQRAIAEEGCDGWLFANFRNRDQLSNRLLGLPGDSLSTRPWFYLIPAKGTPTKIVHAIELSALDQLPGARKSYSSREELLTILRSAEGKRVAAQFSEELPIVSFLDHGTARILQECGFELVSSAGLIQRAVGVIDAAGIQSHERAAKHLYEIVRLVWTRIDEAFARAKRVAEGEVQSWILSEFSSRKLVYDHPPIVGAGMNSSNPHYEPAGAGARLERGQVLQLDLWAKETGASSIFADISWVGVLADQWTEEVRKCFDAITGARDLAVAIVRERLASGMPVTGSEVDAAVRKRLTDLGFSHGLKHRTGHGIDTELHGSGVNLDSVEFPDRRRIIDGSCFSVEPGLYLGEFGVRTEINVYVSNKEARISGDTPQRTLLLLARGDK